MLGNIVSGCSFILQNAADNMDSLTNAVSIWSLNTNSSIEQLTEQFAAQKLDNYTFDPRETDYETLRDTYFRYGGGGVSCCDICFVRLGHISRNHLRCSDLFPEGCEKLNRRVLFYACFENCEFALAFGNRWDALQFGMWMETHEQLYFYLEEDIAREEDTTFPNALQAIIFWDRQNNRETEVQEVERELDQMEVYQFIEKATETDPDTREWIYNRVQPHDRWCFNALVWYQYQGYWQCVERQPGESDYDLFCRRFRIEPEHPFLKKYRKENPTLFDVQLPAGWHSHENVPHDSRLTLISKNKSHPLSAVCESFIAHCRRATRELGKICLKGDSWVWLPQKDFENPDEFAGRASAFETKIRTTITHCSDRDFYGEKIPFYQSVGEPLNVFFARASGLPISRKTNLPWDT